MDTQMLDADTRENPAAFVEEGATAVVPEEFALPADAIFFSRTDDRGVILGGNETFQWASGYDWDELVGAPHKIMRHPDMPKAVFQIMWDGIKKKRIPIVAYVKNRTKNGKYYWVLAFACPIEGGYLSVRIKPQSDMFRTVEKIYNARRAAERAGDTSAEDSAAALLQELGEAGFEGYTHFSAMAASSELLALAKTEEWVDAAKVQRILDISTTYRKVRTKCEFVASACASIELLPSNLEVQSKRLGPLAAPIAIIARDSKERTQNLQAKMSEFVTTMKDALTSAHIAIIESSISMVQRQMVTEYESEKEQHGAEHEANRATDLGEVPQIVNETERDQKRRLKELLDQSRKCSLQIDTIIREVAGINVTRTMCSIESSGLKQHGEKIERVVDDLAKFQTSIPPELRAIKMMFDGLSNDVRDILER